MQGSSSPLELTSAYPIDSSLNQAFFFFFLAALGLVAACGLTLVQSMGSGVRVRRAGLVALQHVGS